MLAEIFRFELRYQLRQPVFLLAAAFFFLSAFLAVTTDAVVIGGAIGNVDRNAPFVIVQLLLVMSLMGVFVTTAFVASPVLRDRETGTHELFFSSPIRKRDYLVGRFAGAMAVALAVFVPVALGVLLGSLMPWLEPERVGPFRLGPYLQGLLVFVVPNVLFTGSVQFALATVTRSLVATYASVVGMFVAYGIAGSLLSDIENESLAAMLDPFGGGAFGIATRYWTVAERNTMLLPVDGALLANRLVVLGLGALVLAAAYRRFSFTVVERQPGRRWWQWWRRGRDERSAEPVDPGAPRGGEGGASSAETLVAPASTAVPALPGAPGRVTLRFSGLRQLARQTRLEVTGVVRSMAFLVILAFGVLNMIGNSSMVDRLFGTPVYPVTHLMISILQGGVLFVLIIVTFYSGELVWRERTARVHELFDALPMPNWALWGAKLIALALVVAALMLVSMLTGMGIQAGRGYYDFEVGLYLRGLLLVGGFPFLFAAVAALFLQVAANNRYLGYLLMILYFISGPVLAAWDFDHRLYQFGGVPGAPYSDMNGFGHFVQPLVWFRVYWTLGAGLLAVVIHLLWVRGVAAGLRDRLRIARQRFTPVVRATAGAFALGFVATGGYIFYNTNVLNEYVPGDLREERLARYERQYKQYEALPQPKITALYAEVDIYPERRAVDIRGRYTLRNPDDSPVNALHLTINPVLIVRSIDAPGLRLELDDDTLGYRIYDLDAPLAPGASMELAFEVAVENPGFVNSGSNTSVVANGTFFNNFAYLPRIGYARGAELVDPNDRRRLGLAPIQRMPSIDDAAARRNHYITPESDWIDFETVVSTSADQIALAPGYLQREWTEGGRRYFHYEMDAPILGLVAWLSADWEVARDRWNDVAIEIYHHPAHTYNVERMIDAVKKSLDYLTSQFSPYQHRQIRIVEFPRYARFAQSLPNTIPFSESIGFIARLDEDDEEAIDYPFYVTAHEVAHQWWAHQVVGGRVQGATVLSETMSQYAALMIMEREYGREQMRRFLKYELDAYLSQRGGELIEELPLLRVENQGYIHYRKGSLVMYALRDYVGEEVLNAALRRYVEAVGFQEPPYTYSREFLSFVREAVPPELEYVIEDLFETITLYDNRLVDATYEPAPGGGYAVRLEVEAKKYRADGQGVETEIPVDDWIDVAVFGEREPGASPEGKLLALEKRKIDAGEAVLELVVDEEPRRAGIDPFTKLIDRNPDNNVAGVSLADGS
ncbi:MAG: ABC transporter permease subunit [Acidobacteria bacterium]|nr:ABC transporter permease subunit [Acidobacteriota bacterium]